MVSKVKGTEGIEFPDGSAQNSAALTAFIGANQLLAPNGYQKLPGGLIVQWGTAIWGGGTQQSVSFPITFPTHVASLVTADNTGVVSSYESLGAGGFLLKNPGAGSGATTWIAIGY